MQRKEEENAFPKADWKRESHTNDHHVWVQSMQAHERRQRVPRWSVVWAPTTPVVKKTKLPLQWNCHLYISVFKNMYISIFNLLQNSQFLIFLPVFILWNSHISSQSSSHLWNSIPISSSPSHFASKVASFSVSLKEKKSSHFLHLNSQRFLFNHIIRNLDRDQSTLFYLQRWYLPKKKKKKKKTNGVIDLVNGDVLFLLLFFGWRAWSELGNNGDT